MAALAASEGEAQRCGTGATGPGQHFKTPETAQNGPTCLCHSAMKPAHAIVIGASAGGVSALLELVPGLPAGMDAAIGVVLHVGTQPSILPELLTSHGRLAASHPQVGSVPAAPADRRRTG